MAILTFSIASLDNVRQISNTNIDYSVARNAETGTLFETNYNIIGQKWVSPNYTVYRMVLSFDTSGLDDSALIESAYLNFGGYNPYSLQDYIMIKNGTPTYPHVEPEEGDYDIDHYSGNGGSVNCSDLVGEWPTVRINLNVTGLGWINKTGWTKFIIVSQKDNNEDPPTGNEFMALLGYGSAAQLVVTYYIPSNIPLVDDPTYSNIKGTYTTATANVSDDSGGYEERGFEYGMSEGDNMWAVREKGVYTGTGDYSLQLTNLLPETTYYARAYVLNDYGTDYSEWTSFTTTDVPSYGIYEESNTPTICFYVRRFGGKWSIKHGPYTTDQADIEIGKILTEGKGKYQIKFTSDVLTGLSVNIMTKLDIRAR